MAETMRFIQPDPQIYISGNRDPEILQTACLRIPSQLAWAARTKYHRCWEGGVRHFNSRHLFSQGLEAGKSKIKVITEQVPLESALPGLQMAVFSLYAHVDFPWCVFMEISLSLCLSLSSVSVSLSSSSSKATNPIWLGPYFQDLLNLKYLLKVPSPNTVSMAARLQYELEEKNSSVHASYTVNLVQN